MKSVRDPFHFVPGYFRPYITASVLDRRGPVDDTPTINQFGDSDFTSLFFRALFFCFRYDAEPSRFHGSPPTSEGAEFVGSVGERVCNASAPDLREPETVRYRVNGRFDRNPSTAKTALETKKH